MDINNNQQINTFLKGMNTDVSDALIDSSQYRYAENLRLVTNTDSNGGELRLIDGTVIRYNLFKDLILADANDKIDIIYLTSIRSYVVAFIRNKTQDTWNIVLSRDKGLTFTSIFGPCAELIWNDGEDPHISGVCRWESDNNIKLYFTDDTGVHSILYIRLDETGALNIEDTTSLKELYGFSDVQFSNFNVWVDNNPGNITAAKVQYAYRFYKTGGATTTLSPLSKMLALYKTDITGYKQKENTGKSVGISIKVDSTLALPKIQIFRINYIENGQPPVINIICEQNVSDLIDLTSTIHYIDDGSNIEEYDVSEFLSIILSSIKPKIIESKGDYLYAANIKYTEDEVDEKLLSEYDVSQITIEPIYTYDEIDCENNFSLHIYDFNQHKTLRSGETYRYGIIFYDEYGNKSTVHWIKDHTVPEFDKDDSIVITTDSLGKLKFTVRRNGIKVNVPYLPNCSGYEIVRCLRTYDTKHVLFQGIIGFPVEQTLTRQLTGNDNAYSVEGKICPTGFFTEQKFNFYAYKETDLISKAVTCTDVLQFACPEYAYLPDDVEDLLKNKNVDLEYVALYKINIDSRKNHKPGINDYVYFPITAYSQQYINNNLLTTSEGYLTHPTGFNNVGGAAVWDTYSYIHYANYFADVQDSLPFVGTVRFINHIIPKSIYTDDLSHWKDIVVRNISFAKSPDSNTFSDGQYIRFQDDISLIGQKEYINWTTPLMLNDDFTTNEDHHTSPSGCMLTKTRWNEDITGIDEQDPKHETENHVEYIGVDEEYRDEWPNVSKYLYPIGTGGCCILLQTNTLAPTLGNTTNDDGSYWLPITVANITKKTNGYGDKKQSVYYSFGNYFPMEPNREDLWGQPNTNNVHISTYNIFDGDAYFLVFNYNASHYFYDAKFGHGKNTVIYSVPLETDIDIRGQYGVRFVDDPKPYIQDTPGAVGKPNGSYTQSEYSYAYNTGYNQEPDLISYVQSNKEDIDTDSCDCRIHVSLNKTNGERIDSWLKFKTLDFLDVDSRFGQITELKLFKDKLIYWQNNATGIIGSNDRTILNDVDSNQIVLGTGSVLLRFDYISTIYGMKPNQFADTQSNTTLYWWDGLNKEIIAYAEGQSVVPLTTIKNVKNYINKNQENNKPHLFYDNKYKELVSSVVNDESLVYSEQVLAFTSIYKFMPLFSTITESELIVSDYKDLCTYNENYAQGYVKLFNTPTTPLLKYVVNNQNVYNKVFDIATFGGRFYGGDNLSNLTFSFDTPLKLYSETTGDNITNREYDFRLNIPRNNNYSYGGRMRGKTMQCELKSSSNSTDFSLQYIITKYRMSWS